MHLENFESFRSLNESAKPKSVEQFVEIKFNDPKFKSAMFDMVASLNPEQIQKVKSELKKLGIKSDTEAAEIAAKVAVVESDIKSGIAETLHNLGAANIAAWGGIPAAIIIGGLTGSGVAVGLAASWGATALLMGLAKLLGE